MYKHSEKQLKLVEFQLPFGGELLASNRWVRLAQLIPWHEFEKQYCSNLSNSGQGPPAFSVRMALAALIIKERLGVTDEECVEQIRENPYLQYFCGLKAFTTKRPFHPTMFVHFRKRFPADVLARMNEVIVAKAAESHRKDNDDNDHGGGTANTSNKGKLVLDATCVPADITYPTDLKLLNTAREKSEQIIDVLHANRGRGHKKPRTYRIRARKHYLEVAKSKQAGGNKLRKALRRQLGYLRRNLAGIDKLSQQTELSALSQKQYRDLLVSAELYRQQKSMYDHRSHRISDRIVSISQPHVRPIKRGKAGSDTEFGAKLSVSLVEGYAFVDRTSWDNFNECLDLQGQVKAYKRRSGIYPESVHADRIYRTRDNLRYCKKHNIRLSGPRLGRPPKVTPENAARLQAEKIQAYQDELDRIPIEGKFGQGKRRFGLGRLMTKLASTSETSIMLCFLVMNLEKWLTAIFLCLFFKEQKLFLGSYLRNIYFKCRPTRKLSASLG
ncbi:MAG: IS5 family transposase [FCB group bacterium]|nr:IS5 family transposase [FCB group bacterium]